MSVVKREGRRREGGRGEGEGEREERGEVRAESGEGTGERGGRTYKSSEQPSSVSVITSLGKPEAFD